MVEAWIRRRGDGERVSLQCGANPQSRAGKEGVMISSIGHVALQVPNLDTSVAWATTVMGPRETQQFIEQMLGFRLSDDVGDGTLLFLRCNADHHGIGITKGGEGLHHYAWELENIGQLGLLGDVLEKNGGRFLWGPGRHGAGGNLFTYHLDPAGCVVEYYADLIKIYDEANYRPGKWEMSDYRF